MVASNIGVPHRIAYLLQSNAKVGQFPVNPPSITVIHGNDVGLDQLVGPELSKDDHLRPRGISLGAFVEEVGRRPCIAEPDGRIPTDPKSDQPAVVVLGNLFEVDPRFVGRQ